jgi:hypothetical protein
MRRLLQRTERSPEVNQKSNSARRNFLIILGIFGLLSVAGCEREKNSDLIPLSSSGQISTLTAGEALVISPTPTPRVEEWQRAIFSPNRVLFRPEEAILLPQSEVPIEIGNPPILLIENRSRESEIYMNPLAITSAIVELGLKGNPPLFRFVDDDITRGIEKSAGNITYGRLRHDSFHDRAYVVISVKNIIRGECQFLLQNPLALNPDETLNNDYLLGGLSLALSQAGYHELDHISRGDYHQKYEEEGYKETSIYGQKIEYGEIPLMFYVSKAQCFVENFQL